MISNQDQEYILFQQLDDPSGNSFIENPVAPKADPNLSRSYFMRTLEQDQVLGLQPPVII